MNTITLQIAATPRNLMRLAQAFGDEIDDLIGAEDVPAVMTAGQKPQEVTKMAVVHEEERHAAEPKDPAAEESVQAAPDPQPEKKVSRSDVRALGVKLTKAGKVTELKEAINSFGAKSLGDVEEKDFAALYEKLEAIA